MAKPSIVVAGVMLQAIHRDGVGNDNKAVMELHTKGAATLYVRVPLEVTNQFLVGQTFSVTITEE